MSEPVRWRIAFAVHPDIDEPADGGSIALAAPEWRAHHASELVLIDPLAQPIVRVSLECDGGGWKPIFYRRRSLALDGRGQHTRLDAIVFGRQRPSLAGHDVTLWLLGHDGFALDCPEELIDLAAIGHLDSLF
jgi:hypothetical protein